MTTLAQAAAEFLAQPRIAVAGVSRDPRQPANLIYRRLRDAGHETFAVNPNAEIVEGERTYETVAAIPGGVDGVVIVTTPAAAREVAADCVRAGIPRVWFHRGMGPGSVCEDAIEDCRKHGLTVIPGGCPNMFGATSDPGHRCMRVLLALTGKIPNRLPDADPPVAPAAQG
jgi:predicted CoA-binding protein